MLHAVRTGVIRDTAGRAADRTDFAHTGSRNRLDPPRPPF